MTQKLKRSSQTKSVPSFFISVGSYAWRKSVSVGSLAGRWGKGEEQEGDKLTQEEERNREGEQIQEEVLRIQAYQEEEAYQPYREEVRKFEVLDAYKVGQKSRFR